MLAELSYSGIKGDDPATWYDNGVKASIEYYGMMATDGKFLDYYLETGVGMQVAAPTQGEIDDYLETPAVKYNPAKGLDMMISQSFINFFKEPNKAWALVKRTGMPNNTTTLMLEKLLYNGTEFSNTETCAKKFTAFIRYKLCKYK